MVKFRAFLKIEKIFNSVNINVLYMIFKHVIWQIRNYFHEIFKFRDSIGAFLIFVKYIILYRIENYFTKHLEISMFLEFEIVSDNSKWAKFRPFRKNHP